jgi:hypothetical protein
MDKIIIQTPAPAKNMAAGLILTFLFGPLGLFYASITGGILLSILALVFLVIGVVTFGLGLVVMPVVWMAAMIWAAVAIDRANKSAASVAP